MRQDIPAAWSRRLTALLLVLVMAVSIVPITALAAEAGPDPPMAAENQTEAETLPGGTPPTEEPLPVKTVRQKAKAASYPAAVVLPNGSTNAGISLSDGQCLADNNATSATAYTDGASYVARYDATTGRLYLKGYQGTANIYYGISVSNADELTIVMEENSSITVTEGGNPNSNDRYGIFHNGKLNIIGDAKLTLNVECKGQSYGIYAQRGLSISAPLDVTVTKAADGNTNSVYGIYSYTGDVSLSGEDMTITVRSNADADGNGIYGMGAQPGSLTITGKLTITQPDGKGVFGICFLRGPVTLDHADVTISGNFEHGIFTRVANGNENITIQNGSNVNIELSDNTANHGLYVYGDGNKDTRNVIISDSTVQARSGGDPVLLLGYTSSIVIRNSTVNLVRTSKEYHVVIALGSGSTNSIDLSEKGSVTLTAPGRVELAMIEYPVSITPGTECTAGMYVSHWNNYKGEYDEVTNTTMLKFEHDNTAAGVEVSGTIKSYGDAGEAVTVTLTPASGGTSLPATLTGATGTAPYSQNYTFAAVPAGDYTLKVTKKGHAPWTENITVSNSNVTGKNVAVYLIGDVNGDGDVTGKDKILLYRYLAEWENAASMIVSMEAADINQDGIVTGKDKILLTRYLSEWSGSEIYFQ